MSSVEWVQAGLWLMAFAAISLWCVLCIAAGVYYGIRWAHTARRGRRDAGPLTSYEHLTESARKN